MSYLQSSGLSLPNSCRSPYASSLFFVPPTSTLETRHGRIRQYKSSSDQPHPERATQAWSIVQDECGSEGTDKNAHERESETSLVNALSSPFPVLQTPETMKKRGTDSAEHIHSEFPDAFPVRVSKLSLTALEKSVKNWKELKKLVRQQHHPEETLILRLLKLERLQNRTIEAEHRRSEAKRSNRVTVCEILPRSKSSPSATGMQGNSLDVAPVSQTTSAAGVTRKTV